MRTTVDIPDGLYQAAKAVALERRCTLRDLVMEGLEQVVQGRTTSEAAGDTAAVPSPTASSLPLPAGAGQSEGDAARTGATIEGNLRDVGFSVPYVLTPRPLAPAVRERLVSTYGSSQTLPQVPTRRPDVVVTTALVQSLLDQLDA